MAQGTKYYRKSSTLVFHVLNLQQKFLFSWSWSNERNLERLDKVLEKWGCRFLCLKLDALPDFCWCQLNPLIQIFLGNNYFKTLTVDSFACFKIKIRSLPYYFGIYKNCLRYLRYGLKQWNYTKIFITSSLVCASTRITFWILRSLNKYVKWNYLQIDWINLYRNDLHRDVHTTGKRDILASVFPSDTKSYAWDASPR